MPTNQFSYITTQADLARAVASRVLAASEVLNASAGMQSNDAAFVSAIISYVAGQLSQIASDAATRASEIAAAG